MKKILATTGLLAGLFAFSGGANAVIATLDFEDDSGPGSSGSFTYGSAGNRVGLEHNFAGIVKIKSRCLMPSSSDSCSVTEDNEGLGVDDDPFDSNPDIDGFGDDERLELTSNKTMRILSITFENVDGNDETSLGIGGSNNNVYDNTGAGWIDTGLGGTFPVSCSGDMCTVSFPGGLAWTTILRMGDPGLDGNDNYTLSAIKAEILPEPGSIALIGLGLAGLGFARRRRQTA